LVEAISSALHPWVAPTAKKVQRDFEKIGDSSTSSQRRVRSTGAESLVNLRPSSFSIFRLERFSSEFPVRVGQGTLIIALRMTASSRAFTWLAKPATGR